VPRSNAAQDPATAAALAFLSRLGHELRTPLNAVLGYGQLLELEQLEPEQEAWVQQILRGGRQLLALVDDVLDISALEAGALRVSLEPVCLNAVLGEALKEVERPGGERGIRFDVAVQRGDLWVVADPHRLRQVLTNVLSNAVMYNRDGGVVTVAMVLSDERVSVVVGDTGAGIADADLARLFTPFERLDAAEDGVGGTGLGLALSRRLARLMQAELTATSVIGAGSAFTLDLKLAPTPGAIGTVPALDASRRTHGGPRTVVYIEDNRAHAGLVEHILGGRPDVTVHHATTGARGLELARAEAPDLVLLDLDLPDMGGEEVLAALRADPNAGRTPVLVVSASTNRDRIARLLAAGADDYVTKPIDVGRFVEVIDALLDGPGEIAS
jgi:CheY-like chemotaxis protein